MVEGYQFREIASRSGANREVVLQSGSITFLISERMASKENGFDQCYPWLRCSCRNQESHKIDSVFNVCLEVGDVDKTFTSMVNNGSKALHPPRTITTPEGVIRYSVVTSPCDNVIHSLVNTQGFSGVFLPGFKASLTDLRTTSSNMLTKIDHVALVANVGDTKRILDWYSKCCGMERFLISEDEDPAVGTVIEDVGMKISAGDWMSEWLCREKGVMWKDGADHEKRNFKLVIAEPLPNREDSHVNSFLLEHCGPGLQHIGISTDSITKTMNILTQKGAKFRKPPPTYYTLEGKVEEIEASGEDPATLQELGILVDAEYKEPKNKFQIFEEDDEDDEDNFLLQIFSYPVFEANTFFMEIIQRKGAIGFGGGNIRALAQSIIELQKQHQERIIQTKQNLSRAPSKPILKTYSQNDFDSLYQFKTTGLNKSLDQNTFDPTPTITLSSSQKLQIDAERLSNRKKRNSSMVLCEINHNRPNISLTPHLNSSIQEQEMEGERMSNMTKRNISLSNHKMTDYRGC